MHHQFHVNISKTITLILCGFLFCFVYSLRCFRFNMFQYHLLHFCIILIFYLYRLAVNYDSFLDILKKDVGINNMAPNTSIVAEDPSLSNNIPDIVKHEETIGKWNIS